MTSAGRHRLSPGTVAAGAWREVARCGFERVAPGDAIEGEHDRLIDPLRDTLDAVLAAWAAAWAIVRVPRPADAADEEPV